jgi:Putative adhesin
MRKHHFLSVLAASAAALFVLSVPPANTSANAPAKSNHHSDRYFSVQDHETIQKSFSLPAGAPKSLEIDNVFGSIEVTGETRNDVQLVVQKTLRAESKDSLERARKEVTLDITQEEGALKLYVNGPFRCHCDDCSDFHRDRDDSYSVKMDFQVRVPRDIAIKVKTVNEGRVLVRNINGSFLVRNVNGDIEMENVSGSGTARTVNGPIKVSFRQNPRENSEFRTVNGEVELRFAHDLSADFRFKTFNGGIYSDFPVTALPLHAVSEERHGGKLVLRADRFTGARIGSGGPEIQAENLNGDIRILENHE